MASERIFPLEVDSPISDFIRKFNLEVEGMTQTQLADLLKQMIASGDIVRYVNHLPSQVDPGTKVTLNHAQKIEYIPFREVEGLKRRIKDLEDLLGENMAYFREIGRGVHGGSSGDPFVVLAQDMHDKIFRLLK